MPEYLEHSCPECGARLVLKPSRFGWFFGCEKWKETGCEGSVGCHPNSKVALGVPAKKTVKRLRIQAHKAFDGLWKNGKMTRLDAYRWMREKMDLKRWQAHIAMFDEEKCKRLMELVAKENCQKEDCV